MARQEAQFLIDDDFGGGGGGGGGTTVTTYKTCPNCGSSVVRSRTTCPSCGYNFSTGTVPTPDDPIEDGNDLPPIVNPGAGTVITTGGNTIVGMNSVGKGTSLPVMRAVKVTSAPTASYSDTDDELVAKAYSQTSEVFPYSLFGVYDDDYVEHLGLSEYTLYPTHANIGIRLKFWKFIYFLTGLKYIEAAEDGIKEGDYPNILNNPRSTAPINPRTNVLSLYKSVGEDLAKETAVRIAVSFDCGGHSSGEGATPKSLTHLFLRNYVVS